MQGRDKDLALVFVISQKNFIAYWLETQISHRAVDGTIWHVHLLPLGLYSQRFIPQKESVGRERSESGPLHIAWFGQETLFLLCFQRVLDLPRMSRHGLFPLQMDYTGTVGQGKAEEEATRQFINPF